MGKVLKILTINVNGFRDAHKRQRLFQLLLLKLFDIVLLPETHCVNADEGRSWCTDSGFYGVWSCGSTRSRGVATLARDYLMNNAHVVNINRDGRLVVVDIDVNNRPIRIVNVYAPNNHAERKAWLSSLDHYFVTNKPTIFGGDFNCVDSAITDKVGGNITYGDVGSDEIRALCTDFHLVDSYRHLHPDTVATTWSAADGSVSCRLDRIYLSKSLSKCIKEAKITPTAVSDHCLYEIELTLRAPRDSQTGPGYWKCNVSTLGDVDLIEDMKDLCESLMSIQLRDAEWWESCKTQFKRLIILHSCRLSTVCKLQLD